MPNSVKAVEQRHRSSEKLEIKGQLTKKSSDWRIFLMNKEHKSQSIKIIHAIGMNLDQSLVTYCKQKMSHQFRLLKCMNYTPHKKRQIHR